MEIVFIRHGQGVHNTDIPDRLNVAHPRLTDKGRAQVRRLVSVFACTADDLFVVSPTVRTIETADLLTAHLTAPHKMASPLVGPRMFPLPDDPGRHAVRCDDVCPVSYVKRHHPDYITHEGDDVRLWTDGINTISPAEFRRLGDRLIDWIRRQGAARTFVVSHDGTITHYRALFKETGLTRNDFLGEAGWHRVVL
ncbi:histidine phosphatase family protein [Paenibacillus flagellatus]|uniref:Histidine phosphatase family protein n=1 Tax=Paenibacillus flagellatus TaxID=2211139 RepID=A0A2V5K043_9BACL|nr:histidine phosphatase family protein [Paenibacillus flagellatus]PYI51922.1 histidine phosphatase family protein [Paenibacillus flagellatus]